MKVKIFTSAFLVVIFATMAFGQATCTDNLSWMATSTVSPNDTVCRTWSHSTNTAYDFTTVWNGGPGEWYLQSPPSNSHNRLQIGGAGQQFSVSNLSVAYITMSCGNEIKRDGCIIQVSFDNGLTWSEVTTRGITLTPPYNYVMSTSTQLEAPPTGLRGIRAYSGTMSAKIKMDLRNGTTFGNAIFRIYCVSDNSVAVEGVHVTGFEYWTDPLGDPSLACFADNSSITVSCNTNPVDPRVTSTKLFLDGIEQIGATCPWQKTGLTNGVSHTVTAVNYDINGRFSPAASCSSTPACTGKPPLTLLLLSKSGGTDVKGSWVQQTAEVPCGSGVGIVDGYYISSSPYPSGPEVVIGTGGPNTLSFFDGVLLDGNSYFYHVLSTKNGVSE